MSDAPSALLKPHGSVSDGTNRAPPRRGSVPKVAVFIKLLVTGIVLAVLARKANVQLSAAAVKISSFGSLFLAGFAFLFIPVIGGLRWWGTLAGLGARGRIGNKISLFSAGMVLGQILPSTAGDGLRVWITAKRGFGFRHALNSVLFERVAMLLALLALVVMSSGLLAARIGQATSGWIAGGALLGGLSATAMLVVAGRLPGRIRHWRILRPLLALSDDARLLLRSRWATPLLLLAFLGNLNFVVAAFFLAQALGLHVSVMDLLAFVPLVTMATTLPISFGGWGVREGMFVYLLGHVGIATGNAFTFSVLFGIGGLLAGVPGFFLWYLGSRGMLADWVAERQAASAGLARTQDPTGATL